MAANLSRKQKTPEISPRKLTLYDLVIGILALFSLIILIPLSFGNLSPSDAAVFISLEDALCVVFLLDFFRSLCLARNKWGYFLKGGGWLDLLGSLPFTKFAIFRLARLFRIVRFMRKLTGGELRDIISHRLAESTLLFTLVIALFLIFTIGWLVLEAEQGNPHANITTYQNAVWWAVVTMTTIGYGDYTPVTTAGRLWAVILMFFGLGVIGVLSSYLASNFILLQKRREARIDGKNGNAANDEDETSNLKAELAAIKEDLAAIKQLLEQDRNEEDSR